MKYFSHTHLTTTGLFVLASSFSVFSAAPTNAQTIIPEANGTGTTVIQNGNRFDISGGKLSGDQLNLFQSFEKFGLNQNQIANFLANPNLQNILGRVVGGEPSIINGLLQITGGSSNINLFLINPAGIVFGSQGSVNIPGSLTLTTANGVRFGNNWFNAEGINNYASLSGSPDLLAFTANQPSAVINLANLSFAEGKSVTLAGGSVLNLGTINVPGGQIIVQAVPGENYVRVSQPGRLLSVDIPIDARPNVSTIKTNSLSQLVEAANSPVATVTPNGDINLPKLGVTIPNTPATSVVSGTLDVSNLNFGKGGNIQVLGDKVALLSAKLDASGNLGGGNIFVGGDYRGTGTLLTATRTFVDAKTNILANALGNGNGGNVVVWANELARFDGLIQARGTGVGNGGSVEVSGKQTLVFRGDVDLSAPSGRFGTLLLDPNNITISNIPIDTGTADPSLPNVLTAALAGTDATISQAKLEGLANSASVVLEAANDIKITTLIGDTLTFAAGNPATSGSITFKADSDNSGVGSFLMQNVGDPTTKTIIASGRDLTISGANLAIGNLDTSTTGLTTAGGKVNLTGTGTVSVNSIKTTGAGGGGNVSISGNAGVTSGAITSDSSGFDAGTISITSTAGNVNTSTGALSAKSTSVSGNGGAVTVTAKNNLITGDISTVQNAVTTSGGQVGGDIKLTSNTGTVSTGDLVTSTSSTGTTAGLVQVQSASGITTGTITAQATTTANRGDIKLNPTSNSGNVSVSGLIIGRDVVANSSGTTTFGSTVDAKSLTTDAAGTTKLGSNVTTTGTQTYNDPVTLTQNTTLTGNGITFFSTVNGTSNLTAIAGAGDLTFTGAVGTSSVPLGDLIVNSSGTTTFSSTVDAKSLTTDAAGTTKLGGNVTTTGTQTYNDPVTLTNTVIAASTGAGDISFKGAVNGGQDLTVNTSGTTTFGSTVDAKSLTTDAAGTTKLGSNVTTTGTQTYNDPVTLTQNTTLTGNGITFFSTVNGTSNLTAIAGAGDLTFTGAVGTSSVPLGDLIANSSGTTTFSSTVDAKSLTTDAAGTTKLGSNVTTTGTQTYNDPVTLTNTVIAASTGAGDISFKGAVNGGQDLTVNTSGTTTFGSTVDAKSLTTDAAGTTKLGSNVTTTGTQTYNDPVTLTQNTTLTGNGITFFSTVNGTSNLTAIAGAGDLTFTGAVGTSSVPLGDLIANSSGTTTFSSTVDAKSLTTDAAGTTKLGSNVTTTGTQTYNDPVTLTNTVIAASTGAGDISFKGAVNGGQDLTVNTSGTTTFGSTVDAKSLTTDAAGTTKLGSNVTTTGTQTYNDPVTLTQNTTLTGNGITFFSTVNGASNLTAIAGAGDLTFTGAVGTSSVPLGDLIANSSGTTTFSSTVDAKSLTTDAAGTTKLGSNVTTTGTQTYNDPVTLTNTVIAASTGAGDISFKGAVNGGQDLTVNTSGTTTFGSTVDAKSLTTDAAGTTKLGSNVTTTGTQTYNDPVTLTQNTTLTGNGITFFSTVNGTSNLTAIAGAGDLTFTGAVGTSSVPLGDLIANSSGTTTFSSTVDAKSLTTDAAGTTKLGSNVTTTGTQTYNDPVTLTNTVIAASTGAGDISFKGAVNGGQDLTVNTSGTTTFGSTVDAKSLTTDAAGTTKLGSNVTTTGTQTYNDPVTLTQNTTLTGNGITFFSTVNGASNLTAIAGAGDLTFTGAVGTSSVPLGDLIANSSGTTTFSSTVDAKSLTTDAAGTTKLGGNVTTTGTQTYNDPVTLTNTVIAASTGAGDISFNKKVDGSQDLTVNTAGTTIFGNTVVAKSLTITANEINFASTVSGTGNLVLQPFTASQPIALGGATDTGTGTLDLTSSDLGAISSGFSSVTIGKADGTGLVQVVGTSTFRNPTTIQSPQGAIAISSKVENTTNNAILSFLFPNITFNSGAEIVTNNGAINIGNNINGTITLSSGISVPINAGSSNTAFNGTVNGNANLSVTGGTASFNNLVGNTQPLSSLNFTGSKVTFAQNVITNGNQDLKGSVELTNSDNTLKSNLGSISTGSITANGITKVQVANSVATGDITTKGSDGSVTILSSNASISTGKIDAGTNVTGSSKVSLATPASITTGDIIAKGDTTLTSLTSGTSATTGNISTSGGALSVQTGTSATLGSLTTSGNQVVINSGTTTSTGDITTSGGSLSIIASSDKNTITTKKINTGSTTSNSGNVNLLAQGSSSSSVTVDSINTSSTNNRGGDVSIKANASVDDGNSIFRATSKIDSSDFSINTTGKVGGDIRISYNSRQPFLIKGSSENGTLGGITTGTQTVNTSLAVSDRLNLGNIQIANNNIFSSPGDRFRQPNIVSSTVNLQTLSEAESVRARNASLLSGQNFEAISVERTQSILKSVEQKISQKIAAISIYAQTKDGKSEIAFNVVGSKEDENSQFVTSLSDRELSTLVNKLYESVSVEPKNAEDLNAHKAIGQELYGKLFVHIEKLLNQFETKPQLLVFSLPPEIANLPISSIYDGQKYLIQKYSLAVIPFRSALKNTESIADIRQSPVLAMGASQFEGNTPLPAAKAEVEAVKKVRGGSIVLFDDEFTPANFIKVNQNNNFKIFHLATHASLAGNDANSRIWFGKKPIKLPDFEKLLKDATSKSSGIDLLVLSACQTAGASSADSIRSVSPNVKPLFDRPDTNTNFALLSYQVGVKTVLGTLWQVADESTAALMIDFYNSLKTSPTTASALRDAQLKFVNEDIKDIKVQNDSLVVTRGNSLVRARDTQNNSEFKAPLSHPYFWAPFTLIGKPW